MMNTWKTDENRFESWDGAKLFYRSWEPCVPGNKTLIVIHRGHEHSGGVEQQIQDLDLSDFWAFSWDCRGHGHSPGGQDGFRIRDQGTGRRNVSLPRM